MSLFQKVMTGLLFFAVINSAIDLAGESKGLVRVIDVGCKEFMTTKLFDDKCSGRAVCIMFYKPSTRTITLMVENKKNFFNIEEVKNREQPQEILQVDETGEYLSVTILFPDNTTEELNIINPFFGCN